jgi:competence protein ComEC
VIPGAAGAVSVTLLTGASMAIPEADHAAFRESGLAHLLAVAGLHIGIVMGFALALSRFGFALSERASLHWPTKKLSAICALAAGAAYMVLTGIPVRLIVLSPVATPRATISHCLVVSNGRIFTLL